MRASPCILIAVLLVTGCSSNGAPDGPAPTTEPPRTTTSFVPVTAAAPTAATAAATTTTPTTRAPTRAEATSRLCSAIGSADSAFNRQTPGGYLAAVRLMDEGIAANERAADSAVVSAARSVRSRLSLSAQIDAYDAAVSAASAACLKAGSPIKRSGSGPVQCIQAPCP